MRRKLDSNLPRPHAFKARPLDLSHSATKGNIEIPRDTTAEGDPTKLKRVLLVDNTPFTCGLLKSALERNSNFEIACSRETVEDVSAALAACKTDIALINHQLDHSPDGIKFLRRIVTTASSIRTIILLDDGDSEAVIEAFHAGARGVIRRSQPVAHLMRGIQAVSDGQIWASSADLNLLLQAFAASQSLQCLNANGEDLLSGREKQILDLIAEGLTNQEVAERLGISEYTVKNHLFRMYEKLGISSRVELILFASRTRG